MPIISIIVAVDQNNAIGRNNQLLCHLPNDLKYFKSITQGHTIIMGRKTYESLPNGALPNRRNIVVSHNPEFRATGCEVVHSIQEAINLSIDEAEIFIIGGGMLYNEIISQADRLYITHIHHKFIDADVFFPSVNLSSWKKETIGNYEADERNKYSHCFLVYERY